MEKQEKRKPRYPGTDYRPKHLPQVDDGDDGEPDFLPGTPITPNYKKFEKMGWSTEKVLCSLNID